MNSRAPRFCVVLAAASLLLNASAEARFLQPDPLGYAAGNNLYAYVQNDPLNATDPSGLDTAVIVGGPIWSNPFGHVAVAVTGGGVYSYGTSNFGSSTTNYLLGQATYRNSSVIIIPTTPQQEAAITQVMNTYSGTTYSTLTCNCATAVINALSAAGIGNNYFNSETASLPNLPATAADIALQQPGATTSFIPQGSVSVPAALNQFNPNPSPINFNQNQPQSGTINTNLQSGSGAPPGK